MKLVVQIQLLPDAETAAKLRSTVERFNEACNWAAGELFTHQVSNKRLELRRLVYRALRDRFALTAQTAILVIHRVCEAFKRDKTIRPEFRKDAAITYDLAVMPVHRARQGEPLDRSTVGWSSRSWIVGSYQTDRLHFPKGQCDLVLRNDGKWFLIVTVDVPEAAPVPVTDFIGIDLGVVNIATDSDGGQMSGEKVEKARRKYGDKRRKLQEAAAKRKANGKRPRSIRRKLAKDRVKESRYKKDVNHCESKRYVELAKGTGRGIAIEDLDGIRDRITARGEDARNRLSGWSFFQFRSFLEYKALVAGVPVVAVDPAYTSQDCAECGHRDRRNRKTQATFRCLACGHTDSADRNGARNIRARALLMRSEGDSLPFPEDLVLWMPIEPPKCRNRHRSCKRNHAPVQVQAPGFSRGVS